METIAGVVQRARRGIGQAMPSNVMPIVEIVPLARLSGVQVPLGANYLFVASEDIYYSGNSDPASSFQTN